LSFPWKLFSICINSLGLVGFGEVGKEKLVYLAKVTQKLSFAEYWEKYEQKRPAKTEDTISVFEGIGNDSNVPSGNIGLGIPPYWESNPFLLKGCRRIYKLRQTTC